MNAAYCVKLQRPAAAIFAFNKLVGRVEVCDLHVLRVPQQFLSSWIVVVAIIFFTNLAFILQADCHIQPPGSLLQ